MAEGHPRRGRGALAERSCTGIAREELQNFDLRAKRTRGRFKLSLIFPHLCSINYRFLYIGIYEVLGVKEVIKEEDEARLSPFGRKHINFLGHFSFS